MNKKTFIEIAIRVYALYLLVQIPFALRGIVSAFSMDQSKFVLNPTLYKIYALVVPDFPSAFIKSGENR